MEIVRSHPLAGVGTGGFAAAYARQVEGTGLVPTVNPHNEYLNIAVQLGLAGLVALGWLFFLVWRHAALLPTPLERDLARGLAIAFVVGSLFNSLLMDHAEGLFFAWGVGVLFGGYATSRHQPGSATP
jgi:O-antigen ligase